MPGTASLISPPYSADYRFTAEELLSLIPDNTSNLIDAKDVRDSVWTLWNRIDDIELIAASAASQSVSTNLYYQNNEATPITVGGISTGTTFVAPKTFQEMFDLLLYPYVAPTCAISGGGDRQFGQSTSITLNWNVYKKKLSITSIIVDSTPQVPTGNDQSGSKSTNGTYSTSPSISQSNSFSMTVGDGTSNISATTNITWKHNRYWGKVTLSGNPNLTTNPSLSGSVGAQITDSVIKLLSGAGIGSGKELSTSFSKTYTNIDGSGSHLVFAFPSLFGTPSFNVNGLPNTAFTKVRSNSTFVNEYGYSINYDVWVSNTAQNSPLNIIVS